MGAMTTETTDEPNLPDHPEPIPGEDADIPQPLPEPDVYDDGGYPEPPDMTEEDAADV